jgi:hypothetical protein
VLRRAFPWLIAIAALLYALIPYFTDDVQLRESLLLAAVYIILASNLNLMIGYAGYVNFGNIVFFNGRWSWRSWLAEWPSACWRCCSGSGSCACAAPSLHWRQLA